jgi:hypothetical protein
LHKSLFFSLLAGNSGRGDRFACDWVRHYSVACSLETRDIKARLAAFLVALSPVSGLRCHDGPTKGFVSALKNLVPDN